jgi:hypothetical protein
MSGCRSFFAEFELVQMGGNDTMPAATYVGVATPFVDVVRTNVWQSTVKFWGISSHSGLLAHKGIWKDWAGRQGWGAGDRVGLLLDCSKGTLAVFLNGVRLGSVGKLPDLPPTSLGSDSELCWAVAMRWRGTCVRVSTPRYHPSIGVAANDLSTRSSSPPPLLHDVEHDGCDNDDLGDAGEGQLHQAATVGEETPSGLTETINIAARP